MTALSRVTLAPRPRTNAKVLGVLAAALAACGQTLDIVATSDKDSGNVPTFDGGQVDAADACSGAICNADAGSGPPPPAASAGYGTQTFNSTTVGTAAGTLQSFNFYGNVEPGNAFSQNADGSVTISGNSGNNYNADLCTAAFDTSQPGTWRGIAFGGGFYAEAALSFTGTPAGSSVPGWPAFWGNDIVEMAQNAVTPPTQWPGQASDYGDWFAIDAMEALIPSANQYSASVHNYYGVSGSAGDVPISVAPVSIGAASFSSINKYGVLWIPATSATQGSLSFFFNRAQVGATIHWDLYDPTLSPPPVAGTSAISVLDTRRVALILGVGNPSLPMTVTSVVVWQGANASNLTQ